MVLTTEQRDISLEISYIYAWKTGPEDILEAAAQCFAQRGYCATTFEQIAACLNCTTGRIFHYYSNKTDLFLDVHRVAVKAFFDDILPIYHEDVSPFERFCKMAVGHMHTMFRTLAFQMVVREGIENYIRGATTTEQRQNMEEIVRARKTYSAYYRKLMIACKETGELKFKDAGVAIQLFFMTLNAPAFCRHGFWLNNQDQEQLIQNIVTQAITGLGADKNKIKFERG